MKVLKLLRTGVLAMALAGGGLLTAVGAVQATAPPGHTVTICHATGSATNPYVTETVDVGSIESFVNGSGHGASGINQGDIIPPFTYTPDNFSFAGLGDQSILANGCQAVTDSPSSAPSPTPAIGGVHFPTAPPTVSTSTTAPTTVSTSTTVPTTGEVLGSTATASTPAVGTTLAATGSSDAGLLFAGLLLLLLGGLSVAAVTLRMRRSVN